MSSNMTFKQWFQHPLSTATKDREGGWTPQLDLQAATPPAVRVWKDFRQQAEAYCEAFSWPSGSVPQSITGRTHYENEPMVAFERLIRGIQALDEHKPLSAIGELVVTKPIPLGMMIQFGQQDVVAVTVSRENEDSALDTDSLEEDSVAAKRSHRRRLIERLYGKLICQGVSFGVYVAEDTCSFMQIESSSGALMISPRYRHDASDFTAKQGLLYLVALAAQQAPTLPPAWSQQTVTALDKDHSSVGSLFQGMDNVQVLSIDNVRLGSYLGCGSAAEVYEVDIASNTVAMKVARVGGPMDNEKRSMSCSQRLVQEIESYEALDGLQGNVIPKLHAYGFVRNRAGDFLPFLTMEKIDGVTLDQAISCVQHADLPYVVQAVTAAFEKLHATGYIQGSVKPQNVMLCENGRVVIIDFGRGCKADCTSTCSCKASPSVEERQVRSMLVTLLVDRMNICKEEVDAIVAQWTEELSMGNKLDTEFINDDCFWGC